MEEESGYTTVNIVRKLIERKIEKLHELLDKRKAALNEELDTIEQVFSYGNETDKKDLEKLSAYRDQTVEIFSSDEGPENTQLSMIESRIREINQRMDLRRVRLEWEDSTLRTGMCSLGVLVISGTKDVPLINEPQQTTGEVDYETINEDQLEAQTSTSETSSPKLPKRRVIKIKPGEYLKPTKQVFRALTSTSLLSTLPEKMVSNTLKHGVDHILDGMKVSKHRSKSVTGFNEQGSQLYCKVPGERQGWRAHLRTNSESVEGIFNPNEQSPQAESQGYTFTSTCTQGIGPGQLLKPKNVAISPETGCIFVAEKDNNRVQVFTQTGKHMYSFGKRTSGLSMMNPYGVCILKEKVYVTQTLTNCIMVFKTNGDYCMQGGITGRSEGKFNFPTGLCTEGTNIYVCDCGNNRVQVLTCNLIFKQVFGVGKLTNPIDIAFDTNSNFFVVLDRSTTVVHIFNMKGVYQRKIINVSKFPTLSNPLFITISPRGNIVLSDLLTCSVNIFTMDGQLIRSLHGKDTFGEPRGITCDTLGRLVVVCHKEQGCLMFLEFSDSF